MIPDSSSPRPRSAEAGGRLPRGDDPFVVRRYGGRLALVGTKPDELSVERRIGDASIVRVRVGDHVYAGDVQHLERLEGSPRIDDWRVVEITPEAVVGRHVLTGERLTWPRERLEAGLAIGAYATNLTDFERIRVRDRGDRGDGRTRIEVVAYGDNGRAYRRRYAALDSSVYELVDCGGDTPTVASRTVVRRLGRGVQDALAAYGFDVLVDEE